MGQTFDAWFEDFARENGGFSRAYLLGLARRYGTRAALIIDAAKSSQDLGEDLGGGLKAREVAYLRSEEWARTADDILWRRTKVGLHVAPGARTATAEAVQRYLDKL